MEKCDILECNFNKAIDLIKSRFVCAIIISLSENCDSSFSKISNEFSYLTNATLSRTLKKLADDKLIMKENNQYNLTKTGLELVEIINMLELWYTKNYEK